MLLGISAVWELGNLTYPAGGQFRPENHLIQLIKKTILDISSNNNYYKC